MITNNELKRRKTYNQGQLGLSFLKELETDLYALQNEANGTTRKNNEVWNNLGMPVSKDELKPITLKDIERKISKLAGKVSSMIHSVEKRKENANV